MLRHAEASIDRMFTERLACRHRGILVNVGVLSLIVTIVSLAGALALAHTVRGARFAWLFRRPPSFRLKSHVA